MDSRFNKCFEMGDYRFQYKDSDAIQGLRNAKNIIIFSKVRCKINWEYHKIHSKGSKENRKHR